MKNKQTLTTEFIPTIRGIDNRLMEGAAQRWPLPSVMVMTAAPPFVTASSLVTCHSSIVNSLKIRQRKQDRNKQSAREPKKGFRLWPTTAGGRTGAKSREVKSRRRRRREEKRRETKR